MNKFFHKGFFKEIFRQLLVPGLICGGLLMLVLAVIALDSFARIADVFPVPTGKNMAGPFILFVYVTGFLFTFLAYGWLNKRSNSDFYHSLPVTRSAMYFSTSCAVLLWMFIGILGFAVLRALVSLVTGTPFNYLLFLCVVINMLIASVEVVGAVSISCALSGTRFLSLFGAAIVLFMPRLLLTVLSLFIDGIQNGTLIVSKLSFLFDPSYNIIGSPLSWMRLGMFNMIATDVDYANVSAMVYTLCYSLLLHAAACVLFVKRRSEAAGTNAAGNGFRRIAAICIGMPLLLVLGALILFDNLPPNAAFVGLLLIAISFVFFCLFSIICTKSGRKTLRDMPWFLVSIGAAALLVLASRWIVRYAQSLELAPEDIKGYYLVDSEDTAYYDIYTGARGDDYTDVLTEDIKFTDEESRRIIAERIDSDSVSASNAGNSIRVRVDRKHGCDVYRRIFLSTREYNKLVELRMLNERYAEICYEFPKGVNYYAVDNLNMHYSNELVKIFKDEYETLSDEMKVSVRTPYSPEYYDQSEIHSLLIYGCDGVKNYSRSYAIDARMPRTYAAYLDMLNELHSRSAIKALNEIEAWGVTKDENVSFDIRIEGNELSGYVSLWDFYQGSDPNSDDPHEYVPELFELISILKNAGLTNDIEDHLIVYTNYYDYREVIRSADDFGIMAIKLSDEDMDRVRELMAAIDAKYHVQETEYWESY
ncbi:MAG: hypothetical protein IKG85_04035 [Clostridia bacterium]|nr:hypothetical protein [Clostridia bacterium]